MQQQATNVRKPLARKPTQAEKEPKSKKQKFEVEEENPIVDAPTLPVKVEEKVKEVPQWDDLDAGDEFDSLMVSEYVNEIFVYLKELEVR